MCEKQIFHDSPEAATPIQVTAFKAANGQVFLDEYTARVISETHFKCRDCGAVFSKHYSNSIYCDLCYSKERRKKWESLPLVEWDGKTPLAVFDDDTFLWDEESAEEYAAEHPDAMLVVCDPEYLHQIDADTWCDELPEDGDLPDDVQTALDALNAVIDKAGPVSWYPGGKRVVLTVSR